MYLSKGVKRQLAIFSCIAVVAGGTMAFGYLDLPKVLFGVGHYEVTMDLPSTGGLYPNANVTYLGVEVGRVQDIRLATNGVDVVLSLKSNPKIPADLEARVHSQSAIGELFVELVPRTGNGPALKDGDVIPVDRTSLPPDINTLLRATNTGLQAIPHGDLETVIDESYTAVGGLGPELSRIVKGTTTLAADARNNLDAITNVIDHSKPILDSQTDTASSIQNWASHVADVTRSLKEQDPAFRGVLDNGPGAVTQVRDLIDRVKPTLPVVLTNLVSLEQVAITYQPALEQLLVLVPADIQMLQAAQLANRDTKQAYNGLFLSFNLNANLPVPCTTGFLPPQQVRAPSEVDYPSRPPGDMYCRVPQNSNLDVRGARNMPCLTRPGKRAPTVKLCESDEEYVPLNDGYNWKGDPNATLSGQPVPGQPPADAAPAAPPLAIAQYDPATGTYTGPDGKKYTQSDIARGGSPHSWQDLVAPHGN